MLVSALLNAVQCLMNGRNEPCASCRQNEALPDVNELMEQMARIKRGMVQDMPAGLLDTAWTNSPGSLH